MPDAVIVEAVRTSVPAVTVNRACGSSQQALDAAAYAVMAGQQELVVARGVESTSRVVELVDA